MSWLVNIIISESYFVTKNLYITYQLKHFNLKWDVLRLGVMCVDVSIWKPRVEESLQMKPEYVSVSNLFAIAIAASLQETLKGIS